MKAVVTGGCGLIGAEVVSGLENLGADILVIDNLRIGAAAQLPRSDRTRLLQTDILDVTPRQLRGFEHACWFHLAALPFIPTSFKNPGTFFETNTLGTSKVCQIAVETHASRFVHISTCEVYRASESPLTEDAPVDPLSPYANSKLFAEISVARECGSKLPFVLLRPFNSYGPRMTQPYFIPEMIRQCLVERRIRVGNLDPKRDFTFVTDTARAIILAGSKDTALGETFNIGSGVAVAMRDLLAKIIRLAGYEDMPVAVDTERIRPTGRDPMCFVACNQKAKKLLGWQPEVDLDAGLRRTLKGLADQFGQDELASAVVLTETKSF